MKERNHLKVVVAGSNGLIGSALTKKLLEMGWQVIRLVRSKSQIYNDGSTTAFWQPEKEILEVEKLKGVDAVVNLASETVFGRWTSAKLQRIRDSRILGLKLLLANFAQIESKTYIFATGFSVYGNTGDVIINESAPHTNNKVITISLINELEELCANFDKSVQVVNCVTAVVLSSQLRFIKYQILLAKFRLLSYIPIKECWFPWISLPDIVNAIVFSIRNSNLRGRVFVASPATCTFDEFQDNLCLALNVPKPLFRMPKLMIEAFFGKNFTNEMLLSSCKVEPAILKNAGFQWKYENIKQCIPDLVSKVF